MKSTAIRRRSRRRRSTILSPPAPANNGNGGVQSLLEDDDGGDDRPGLGKGRGKGKGDPDKFPPEPISTSEAIAPSSSLIQPPPPSETTSDLPTTSASVEIPESTSPSLVSAPAPETSSHIESQSNTQILTLSTMETSTTTNESTISAETTTSIQTTTSTTPITSITLTTSIAPTTRIVPTTSIRTPASSITIPSISTGTSKTRIESNLQSSTNRAAYSTTSSIPPIQALNNEHGLRPGQIAGIVVGLLAFVFLTIASVLVVFRSRRKRTKKYSGQKGLLDSTPGTPQPTHHTKHETAGPPTAEEPQLFNTTADTTTEKVIPPTTRLSQWLNQLRHSHIPGTGTGTSRKSLPHITIGATSSTHSDVDDDDDSSMLSIPTTFVTRQGRHTNSTFLPTTPLHHPRYLAPPPPPPSAQRQGAGNQNLQPPASPRSPGGKSSRNRRSGATISADGPQRREGPPPPMTPTSPASFLQSGPSLPAAARLSGVGGGEGKGFVKVQVQVRRPS